MKMKSTIFTLSILLLTMKSAFAAPRDVQFRSVNFETSVMELHNFGSETESLNGWRFCSHDENQVRRYSSSAGLNGISLAAGESLFIHFLNDAPVGDSSRINIAGRGAFALPLDRGPYAIQIYFPPISFGNGGTIADHIQWSINGVDNTTADERSDEAQAGGVWTNQSLWISTNADTDLITLNDTTGGVLHSPDDYTVSTTPVVLEPFEVSSIGVLSNGDVSLAWDVAQGATYEIRRSTTLSPGSFQLLAVQAEGAYTDTNPPIERAFYQVTEVFSQ